MQKKMYQSILIVGNFNIVFLINDIQSEKLSNNIEDLNNKIYKMIYQTYKETCIQKLEKTHYSQYTGDIYGQS